MYISNNIERCPLFLDHNGYTISYKREFMLGFYFIYEEWFKLLKKNLQTLYSGNF